MSIRSPWRRGKWLTLMVLALAMTGAGVTYTAWHDTLNITGRLTTAAFHMAASPSEAYRVSLLSPQGELSMELSDAHAQPSADGTSVELDFPSGLPAQELREGYYLRLSVPIENDEGTLTDIRRYEPDFDQEWSRISLKPKEIMLLIGGEAYQIGDDGSQARALLSEFDRELELAVYRSFEGEPGQLRGSLYFALTQESVRLLDQLPSRLTLDRQELEDSMLPIGRSRLQRLAGGDGLPDGVLVRYSCQVPLAIDQNHQPDPVARAGKGART